MFVYNFLDLQRVRWEGADALTPDKHTLEFDFKSSCPALACCTETAASGPAASRSRMAELSVSTKQTRMATDAGGYLVLPGIVDLHGDARAPAHAAAGGAFRAGVGAA